MAGLYLVMPKKRQKAGGMNEQLNVKKDRRHKTDTNTVPINSRTSHKKNP